MANDTRRQGDGVRLDEEGNWFQGDYPILHERTFRYLHKHITRDEEGRYYLTGEDKPIYFSVEDVPYWVVKLERTIVGYLITLTDESIELLDSTHLWTGKKGTLYCLIKGGNFAARFNRAPYYEITKELEQKGNKFFITVAGKKYPIQQGPPAEFVKLNAGKPKIVKPKLGKSKLGKPKKTSSGKTTKQVVSKKGPKKVAKKPLEKAATPLAAKKKKSKR